ncbi:hypothetical protein DVQ44_03440 [Yersinia enterocolitica]|jgi:hypothetical protein|nr:hypothetical protein [Yersinia enterocolitica]EKN6247055.1 hypothetical protein [Yersinia enterocolitica]EKN6277390.1 hypothetical protein [Yersinia enterocolitica]
MRESEQGVNRELTSNAELYLEKYGLETKEGKFILKKELILGLEYDILSFKKKSVHLEWVVDIINNEIISTKEIFIDKKATHSFIKVAILPYLLFDFCLFISSGTVDPGRFVLFFLPIMYGYIIYAMAYAEAKDYLKKTADTITFFSAVLTASFVLLKDISLTELLNSDKNTLSFRVMLFLIMQTFAIFATTKFCISLNETFVERKKYLESLPKSKEEKVRNGRSAFKKTKEKHTNTVIKTRKFILSLINKTLNNFFIIKNATFSNIKKIFQFFHRKA